MMLPAKRARPVYRDMEESLRDELNAAKRSSRATRPTDAARRNTLQVAAMAKLDSELPALQEDIKAVMHKCRFSDPKATGDRDLAIITWRNKQCELCFDNNKDARFYYLRVGCEQG